MSLFNVFVNILGRFPFGPWQLGGRRESLNSDIRNPTDFLNPSGPAEDLNRNFLLITWSPYRPSQDLFGRVNVLLEDY